MTKQRLLAVVILVVLLVTFVRPARAEALEPMTVILIVSGAIVVIALVAVLIIANVTEYRRGTRAQDEDAPVLLAWQPASTQSP